MTRIEELKKIMDDSGMTFKAIAEKSGIPRETLYNRMRGVGEFTASEIIGLSTALHMSKPQRDYIFLDLKLK